MSGDNILIEPSQHYVLIFDWSCAEIHSDAIPIEARLQDISHAAQAVVVVLGGDLETESFPDDHEMADDGSEVFERYTRHLLGLDNGNESNAKRAHANFYQLIDSFWASKFHPFTTKPL